MLQSLHFWIQICVSFAQKCGFLLVLSQYFDKFCRAYLKNFNLRLNRREGSFCPYKISGATFVANCRLRTRRGRNCHVEAAWIWKHRQRAHLNFDKAAKARKVNAINQKWNASKWACCLTSRQKSWKDKLTCRCKLGRLLLARGDNLETCEWKSHRCCIQCQIGDTNSHHASNLNKRGRWLFRDLTNKKRTIRHFWPIFVICLPK